MVTGASASIYGLARNMRQGSTIASVVYLFMAFVGGSFIQVDDLPGMLQRVSSYTPFNWATVGFRELILFGGGLADILPQIGLLAGLGLVLLFVGGRMLHRRMLQGAVA